MRAHVTRDVPRWSPDGSQIAFQIAEGGNYDIGVATVRDRSWHRVAAGAGYDGMYGWSPDGKRLVFVSGRDANERLYTVGGDGQDIQRITEVWSLDPAWAP